MNCPCKDCLTYIICKNRRKNMEDVFKFGDVCPLFKEYLKYFYSKNSITQDPPVYEEALERFIIIVKLFPFESY
jgi:hypothetical protein